MLPIFYSGTRFIVKSVSDNAAGSAVLMGIAFSKVTDRILECVHKSYVCVKSEKVRYFNSSVQTVVFPCLTLPLMSSCLWWHGGGHVPRLKFTSGKIQLQALGLGVLREELWPSFMDSPSVWSMGACLQGIASQVGTTQGSGLKYAGLKALVC